MSAVFDTPLNGLGVIPLVSSVEGLSMSKSYREALNALVSACRGERHGDASHIIVSQRSSSWLSTESHLKNQ